MFELYYSTGGHGGPNHTLLNAKKRAIEMLDGNLNEKWITIQNRSTNVEVARISRKHLQMFRELGQFIEVIFPSEL